MADTLESLEIEVKHKASGADSELAKVTEQIKEMSRAIASALPQLKQFAEALGKVSGKVSPAKAASPNNPLPQEMRDAISSASKTDILEQKLYGLREAMNEAFEGGNVEKAYALRSQIIQTEAALEKAGKAGQAASKGIKETADAAKKGVSPLSNFAASLKRIAFYRFIRSVLKSITQAFSEGLEKAYLFSQSVGEDGNRFAAAMDRIKSSGNAMKGQIGSAFISLLTAIEPVLVQLINLVTKAADAISQLLAAFTGKTYLKANATAASFADNMKKGGAAAKEWKNQLLGFDEINRLNAPSNGGGGGGTNPLDGYDLEATDISEFWQKVAEKLRPIIEGIKLIFKGLVDFVTGLVTGDWEKTFEGLANIVDGARKIIGGILDGIKRLFSEFVDAVKERGNSLLTYIEGKTGLDLTSVKEKWNNYCDETKSIVTGWVDDIKNALNGLCDFLKGAFLGDWELVGQGITAIFDAAWSAVVRTVESAVGWLIRQVENVLALINSITGASLTVRGWLGRSNELMAVGASYATGGFPEDGLFFANHGELVGQFSNGQTAVANNEQITDGIRRAVVEGMSAVLSGGNSTQNVNVYLDGKQITNAVTRNQSYLSRATGVAY